MISRMLQRVIAVPVGRHQVFFRKQFSGNLMKATALRGIVEDGLPKAIPDGEVRLRPEFSREDVKFCVTRRMMQAVETFALGLKERLLSEGLKRCVTQPSHHGQKHETLRLRHTRSQFTAKLRDEFLCDFRVYLFTIHHLIHGLFTLVVDEFSFAENLFQMRHRSSGAPDSGTAMDESRFWQACKMLFD